MPVRENVLDRILDEVEQLTAEERIRLVQRVMEKFVPQMRTSHPHKQLEYGKFADQWEISDDDFNRDEWGPEKLAQLEDELSGK